MTRIISLTEASQLVSDNMTLALGGMTVYRRPVAFVHALLRRKTPPKNLTLLSFTAGYESDILIGAGCVSRVRSCYFGLEAFGIAPMFTEAAGRGAIEIIEETETSLALGLRAKASHVGFLPSKAWSGTDLPRLRPDVREIHDPYSGERLFAFPEIGCDVAVLHALEGDAYGSIRLNHNLGVDAELCAIADILIVTVEKLVERVVPDSTGLVIPPPGVDYIALAPHGAYPTSCFPEYPIGGGEILRYIDRCNAGEFSQYLDSVLADGS
ncbi:MAG: 3-oxoadipate:succinyl-CoA transferase subunit B [Chloroflexi bacterium OLB15]|nr:MAG: 3-oxoadipate:succinyl-CoA transferase subunit B [Chloroflexi bacterium OLB15]